jgi:hypothetical protein
VDSDVSTHPYRVSRADGDVISGLSMGDGEISARAKERCLFNLAMGAVVCVILGYVRPFA